MFMRFLGGGIGHKVMEHIQQNIVDSRDKDDHKTTQNAERNIFIFENTETEPIGCEDENEVIEEVDANEELDFGYGSVPESASEDEEDERKEDSDDEEDNYDEL